MTLSTSTRTTRRSSVERKRSRDDGVVQNNNEPRKKKSNTLCEQQHASNTVAVAVAKSTTTTTIATRNSHSETNSALIQDNTITNTNTDTNTATNNIARNTATGLSMNGVGVATATTTADDFFSRHNTNSASSSSTDVITEGLPPNVTSGEDNGDSYTNRNNNKSSSTSTTSTNEHKNENEDENKNNNNNRDDGSVKSHGSIKDYDGNKGWWFVQSFLLGAIIISIFFGAIIKSGLVLQERSVYELELFACNERFQQLHHEVGLSMRGDDETNNSYTDDSDLQEQKYYWQELQEQVRYWKKEAKMYQRYADGYKHQCNDDLQKLHMQGSFAHQP